MLRIPIYSTMGFYNIIKLESGEDFYEISRGDYACVQALIQADTDKKIHHFLDRYKDFFNYDSKEAGTFKDVSAIRKVLISAFDLWTLSQKDKLRIKDFQVVPITLYEFTAYEEFEAFIIENEVPLSFNQPGFEKENVRPLFNKFLQESGSLISGIFKMNIEADYYLDFISKGIKRATEQGFMCMYKPSHKEGEVKVFLGTFSENTQNLSGAILKALDVLFIVHLQDVMTITNECVLYQSCDSILSSIWLNINEAFIGGRSGRCKACSKPFVAYNERGNRRLYCSQACNKKHQRLKRFKNLIDKGYKQEEASKLAKIRLKDGLEFIENITSSH